MATTVQSLAIKTFEQIRDDYLRTFRNGLIKRGVANPDVSEGTLIFNKATALAQQIYAASVSVPLAADAQMPDTAQGDDLVRICRPYNLSLRPASPSAGPLVLAASVSTPIAIPQGAQLIDPNGLVYQVALGGPYSVGGAPIPLTSVATGAATDLAQGTVLKWVSPPAYCYQTASIGLGGLKGGNDAEDYEGLRARLLERLQTPPNGDDWASLVTDAEQTTAAVGKAFAYPAANGPATEHVAVAGAPTASSKSREVDTLITLPTVVIPGVLANRPAYVETVVTTVQDYPFDLSVGLSLPSSPLASPQGPGGGWTDGNPFPTPTPGTGPGTFNACAVSAVTSSTTFQVQSANLPIAGSQIAWVSRDDWQLRTAKVVTVGASTGSAGNYQVTITIDTPFVSASASPQTIAVNDYVFPNAVNMAAYVAAWLAGFAAMGPGEKTAALGLMPRALRRPLASQAWPSAMLRPFLRNFTDAGDEVGDAQFLAVAQGNGALPAATVVSTVGGVSLLAPPLPSSITQGPYIAIPGRVAFYPI